MSKNIHILPLVTWCLVTLSLCYGFASCASQAPLDDAYHWEDKPAHTTPIESGTSSATSHSSASIATSQASSTSPASPSLEYTNIQDTTITVRIKR